MITFTESIEKIIRKRFSCRTYDPVPIARETADRLSKMLSSLSGGPFGTRVRFRLICTSAQDADALQGLGTYGFIKGVSGFIVGSAEKGVHDMEDYGYLMENAILFATDMGLGTCWLGGTFSKSHFSRKISLKEGESIPAVAAVGYAADRRRWLDSLIRQGAGADNRLGWPSLFFDGSFNRELTVAAAGALAFPLEMVRLGPSASNRQPWRIVRAGAMWHFYLQRTRGYGGGALTRRLQIADLQRIDMGIAMCHFERASLEQGLTGEWIVAEPGISMPDDLTGYIVTWRQTS
jgi:nitroreductase